MFTTFEWREKAATLWHLLRDGDLSQSPRWARVAVYPVRVLIRAFEEFLADKCPLRAASLAYASLLALVPVTAIFFFSLTKLDAFTDIQLRVEDFLFKNFVPARTEIIQQHITEYIHNINYLGVFGFVVLFVVAIFLFNTIEHTINDIWHAKQRRPFLSKFMAFWTVLTATPFLVVVSSYIAAKLTLQKIDVFSLKFLPYLLNWAAFWFAYQFIPYTQVRFRAAIIGAVVGGTLWEAAKGGFKWYISHMTTIDVLYGSLGAVPVFLVWLYFTWLIVLFGAEVAYAVQYPRQRSHLTQAELASFLDFYSVRAMAELVKRFNAEDGSAASAIDSLRNIGIPPEILGEILNRLSEKQLIVYTEDKDYVPARQPSSIMVREVVEAVSGKKMLAPDNATDAVSTRLRKTFQEITADIDSALDELDIGRLVEESEQSARIGAEERNSRNGG